MDGVAEVDSGVSVDEIVTRASAVDIMSDVLLGCVMELVLVGMATLCCVVGAELGVLVLPLQIQRLPSPYQPIELCVL